MMQIQASGGILQHAPHVVHWLTALRDSQAANAQNVSEHPGPILSLRYFKNYLHGMNVGHFCNILLRYPSQVYV